MGPPNALPHGLPSHPLTHWEQRTGRWRARRAASYIPWSHIGRRRRQDISSRRLNGSVMPRVRGTTSSVSYTAVTNSASPPREPVLQCSLSHPPLAASLSYHSGLKQRTLIRPPLTTMPRVGTEETAPRVGTEETAIQRPALNGRLLETQPHLPAHLRPPHLPAQMRGPPPPPPPSRPPPPSPHPLHQPSLPTTHASPP